ncbi:TNFAIP3-interacting protein 2 [Ascaphus truei]|uniref:TNFAIP3-interacting protein 2 n=1 Tax=Ascaphus truei TaxID=8439 RepID=UPI003F593FCD
MSCISDGSTDPLLARFKLLEETVEKLHRENRTLKTKLQSFNTLSTFYHEARQQIRNLNMQVAAKDNVIQGLKDTQGISGTEEHQVVGPSKSLVESLLDQLSKVKSHVKEAERTAEEKVGALSQEVQRLHQQLGEKNGQMQQSASWPPHEKEIFQLQRTLAEKDRLQETSEVLCRSLSDETHQLRRKLEATAKMCQHLVKCLQATPRIDNRTVEDQLHVERPSKIQHADSDTETSHSKLQEENRLLKQKVIYVEDLNAKWQKYDASREEYVKGLHKEMKARREHHKAPHTAQTHADIRQKEIIRLNKLLEEKMNECTNLKQEVENARVADGERIQMLEQQVLVYKDDFTSERTDRERAQCRIQELMEEVACLEQQASRRQDEREPGAHFQIYIGNKNNKYTPKKVTETLRGSSSDHAEVKRQVTEAEHAAGRGNSGPEKRGQDELQCPRCLRLFQDKLGENFLEHISECCQ